MHASISKGRLCSASLSFTRVFMSSELFCLFSDKLASFLQDLSFCLEPMSLLIPFRAHSETEIVANFGTTPFVYKGTHLPALLLMFPYFRVPFANVADTPVCTSHSCYLGLPAPSLANPHLTWAKPPAKLTQVSAAPFDFPLPVLINAVFDVSLLHAVAFSTSPLTSSCSHPQPSGLLSVASPANSPALNVLTEDTLYGSPLAKVRLGTRVDRRCVGVQHLLRPSISMDCCFPSSRRFHCCPQALFSFPFLPLAVGGLDP